MPVRLNKLFADIDLYKFLLKFDWTPYSYLLKKQK